jgi:hypothetical protein
MQRSLLILAVVLTALSCTHSNPSPQPQLPIVTTDPVTNISTTSATGSGTITGNGLVTSRGIQWDNDSAFSHAVQLNSGTGTGSFSIQMYPLVEQTTYYVRAFASNNTGTAYGHALPFTTLPISPLYTVSTFSTVSGAGNLLMGVTLDANGNVFTVGSNGNIWKLAPDGTASLLGTTPGPTADIACDPQGNLYVLVPDLRKIYKTTPAGVTTLFAGGATGQVDGQGAAAGFLAPEALCIDPTGTLYVIDGISIRTIDPAAHVTTLYTAPPSSGQLSAIAIDQNHTIYFADEFQVWRLDAQGSRASVAGQSTAGFANGIGAAAAFEGIFGLSLDKAGNLVAADKTSIREITPAGVVTTIAGGAANGFKDGDGNIAAFTWAIGLTIDANGAIYVADDVNQKIRKIVHK